MARLLKRMKFCPDAVVTSPLSRARETAEIVTSRLGLELQIEPDLAHGFDGRILQRMISKTSAEQMMLVGHEPEFSAVIKELTGGEVKLAKAGIALIELNGDGKSGKMLWLLPPRVAKAARVK